MRIDGVIPHHVARAYGVARPPGPKQAGAVTRPGQVQEARSAGPTRLVAGALPSGAATAAEQPTTTASGSLALYTRAADRVEAAVALQIGRSIDVTG